MWAFRSFNKALRIAGRPPVDPEGGKSPAKHQRCMHIQFSQGIWMPKEAKKKRKKKHVMSQRRHFFASDFSPCFPRHGWVTFGELCDSFGVLR